MEAVQNLQAWMTRTGHTIATLSAETGMSYDGLYALLITRERISDSFKWRFAQRFGWDVAQSIFGATPTSDPEAISLPA